MKCAIFDKRLYTIFILPNRLACLGILGGNATASGEVGMRRHFPFRVFLIVVWMGALGVVSACGDSYALVQTTQTPIPTCIPPLTTPNPYSAHTMDEVVKLYTNYMEGLSSSNALITEYARKEAYLRLAKNAEHWSSTRNLRYDQSHLVRVTVTFLDPALIQYVILNQYLYNAEKSGANIVFTEQKFTIDAFRTELTLGMQQIAERQELVFLITITLFDDNTQIFNQTVPRIRFPFEDVVLINAMDLEIRSSHDDHNLSEPIELNNNLTWGIVSFPLALSQPTGGCLYLYDLWNTTLTLKVSEGNVGDDAFDELSWTVPFDPLIDHDLNYYPNGYHYQELFTIVATESMVRTPAPPTPSLSLNPSMTGLEWEKYWQEMGQFFWHVILTELHH